jgi:hypothetical protein
MTRLLWIAALLATVSCGPAFAQDQDEDAPEGPGTQRVIADPDIVGAFYTDGSMNRLAPPEQLVRAWNALSPDVRNQIRAECASPEDDQEDGFCSAVSNFE